MEKEGTTDTFHAKMHLVQKGRFRLPPEFRKGLGYSAKYSSIISVGKFISTALPL